MVLRVPIGSWMPFKRVNIPKTNRHGAILQTLKLKNYE